MARIQRTRRTNSWQKPCLYLGIFVMSSRHAQVWSLDPFVFLVRWYCFACLLCPLVDAMLGTCVLWHPALCVCASRDCTGVEQATSVLWRFLICGAGTRALEALQKRLHMVLQPHIRQFATCTKSVCRWGPIL